jgi:protein phosphatase 2C
LARNGVAIPRTTDHKPSWPKEKMRINKVNLKYGTNEKIHFSHGDFRIGDLSVSRSFGDLDNTPYVTHKPDICKYKIDDENDEFIVMACDGLWDVMRSEEVVNFVYDHIYNNVDENGTELYVIDNLYPSKKPTTNIAEKLADFAIAKGLAQDISGDNITIIILVFH